MERTQVQQVLDLSGLPQDEATDFLKDAFLMRGKNFQDASLEDLREILADLLQDMILANEEM